MAELHSTKNSLFANWLLDSAPGEKTIYHYGNLAFDRANSPWLNERAREAEQAAEQGLVRLMQIRYYNLSAASVPRNERLTEQGYGFAYCYLAERTAKRDRFSKEPS